MDITDLRIALFSGNYNYTRDGANQALNRLAEYILRQGAALRVYSPVVENPDFEATGDLVDIPNVIMPVKGRSEYRMPLYLGSKVKRDLDRFAPNILHLSSPDPAAHKALKWARKKNIPVLSSVHTRFETYPRYYGLDFLEPIIEAYLRRFYNRCDALVAPSASQIAELKAQRMHDDITIWSRGVDRDVFASTKRDMQWRRAQGLADDDVAIVFLGRLVMEKGLDVFAETIAELHKRQVQHKVLVIGDGPARDWFKKALPGGIFVGFQTGKDLGRALASGDIFLNPSITESFGNVTLEAMACGLPVVAAGATGASSLILDGQTGRLIPPGNSAAFADALTHYCTDNTLRRAHGSAGEHKSHEYSWDAINQEMIDVYLRLIKRNVTL